MSLLFKQQTTQCTVELGQAGPAGTGSILHQVQEQVVDQLGRLHSLKGTKPPKAEGWMGGAHSEIQSMLSSAVVPELGEHSLSQCSPLLGRVWKCTGHPVRSYSAQHRMELLEQSYFLIIPMKDGRTFSEMCPHRAFKRIQSLDSEPKKSIDLPSVECYDHVLSVHKHSSWIPSTVSERMTECSTLISYPHHLPCGFEHK